MNIMDASGAQHHHQEMGSQTLESMLVCTKAPPQDQNKKPRPAEQALKCPRCDSANTKFCYYNNYSLSQPRYFCKSCRRYWTKGGTLRNVPVGGGCRKNKRSSSSSSSTTSSLSSSSKARPGQDTPPPLNPLVPVLSAYDTSDLSLAIARLQKQTSTKLGFADDHEFPFLGSSHFEALGNPNSSSSPVGHGLLDALRSGFLEAPGNKHNNGGLGLFHNYYNYGNNVSNHHHVENNNGGGLGIHNNNDNDNDNNNNNNNMCGSEEIALSYDHHHQQHEDHTHNNNNAATTTSTAVTTVKQERENGENNNNRVLWGFPWQIGASGDINTTHDLDSGRQSWINSGFGSTWHGLLNGPLM